MRLFCLAFATISLSVVAQEFAFPLTARLQSRIPAGGLPADSFYLPGSSDVTCFEGTASGSRILCLSDSGSILEWTADDRIRQVADGFVGPLQAKVAPNGSIYVLDKGRGTLSKIAPNGTVTVVMKSGSDRVIRPQMDPATFDLPLFVVSRDNYLNSAQLGMDPQGNPYLGFLRQETNNDTGTKRFLFIFRLESNDSALVLHWDGSATLANATSLPSFDALSVDKDRNIFFSTDGKLNRLTPSLQYTALVDGRYTVLNSNPVQGIVQTDDGNIFLHSRSSKAVFRLAFADLRVDLDSFASLTGFIARQGNQLIGLDLQQKRSLKYTPDATKIFVPQMVSRLLRYIPTTGNNSFRAAFDNPVSVSVDLLSQVFVADAEDMSVYRIAANGTVTRVAQSNYNPDVPVTRPITENQPMDSMPYPIIALAHDIDGHLLMIDSNCTFFVQTGNNTARRAGGFSSCADASMVYDQAKRLHVALPLRGQVVTGTGDTLTGDWQFTNTFTSSSRVRSISMLPIGDVLVLEGTALGTWSMKRVNPNTKVVTPIRMDDAIANGNNLNLTSIAVDAGGRILAVACCTIGSSNESSRRYLYNFQLSSTNVLSGTPRPVTFYDGPGQVPDRLFSHPRGVLIRSNQNRIYYFEDQQFRSQASVSLPNRQTWTYQPDAGLQELAVPVFPGYGPTAFRTKLTCDRGFEKFLRLGPSAAVAPTQLRLALDTLAAPSRSASCKIELSAVDTARVLATTTIDLVPDAAILAKLPSISLLEQVTPFKVDPTQPAVSKSVRLFNNSPENVDIQIEGDLPDGITVTPAVLTLEPKQSGEFTFAITPQQLFRQSYQLPLRANCATCKAAVPFELSFQITGRTTSIDISAESALVDIAALNTRNSSRQGATSIVLTGLDETDVSIKTDQKAATPWYKVERSTSVRTDDGKLVLGYDVVLERSALPTRQTSSIVTFETQTQQGVARRFLTVFFYPEGSTVQRLYESGAAGSTLNLSTARTATLTIPVFSRADAPAVYSTYTLGGDTGTVSVPSTQGVVGKGRNEILLDVSRSGNTADGSEIKDIVVLFANGEKLIYNLNVITAPIQATQQVRKGGDRAIGSCASARLLISPKSPGMPYTVVRNVGLRFVFELKDECNQLINGSDKAQVRFTTEPANGSVTVTPVGNGLWEVFWKPERTGENLAAKVVAVRGISEREIYVGTMTVNGRVADSAVPSLKSFSVVDAISYQQKSITAPGAFITIYGENLAIGEHIGMDQPGIYPTELNGLQVEFNGKAAPLLYASPSQVNLQVPYDLESSEYRMVLRRGEIVSAPSALGVATASPAIFTLTGTGQGQGQIFRLLPDVWLYAVPETPARVGEYVRIVTTGLGATNPYFDEGRAVTGDTIHFASNNLQVRIGGQNATNVSGYLAEGLIGIYLVTAVVPEGVPTGDAVPVVVRANGVDSQTVTMAIQ